MGDDDNNNICFLQTYIILLYSYIIVLYTRIHEIVVLRAVDEICDRDNANVHARSYTLITHTLGTLGRYL